VIVAVGAVAARAVLGASPRVRLPDDHGRRLAVSGAEVVVLLHPANASRHPAVWPTYRPSLLALFGELAARAGFPVVEVAAAVIRHGTRYLVTQRGPAQHLAGLWEFPGGKREPGESIEACLARELNEELGVRIRVGERLALVPWAYPDRCVLLHFYRCRLASARITSRESQPYRWVTRRELAALPMPPADATLVAALSRSRPSSPRAGRAARPGPSR
jgi:8-oxo-dGTP diphosphatase